MKTGATKRVKVIGIVEETENAKSFILEPIDWLPLYHSGQFLTLIFQTPFGEKRRSYSISSSPVAHEPLMITVKKVDNGEFSRWLIYQVTIGTILFTSGISGLFVLPEEKTEHTYCFLAAGSGITPCYSMIKTVLLTTSQKLFLFYSNHSEKETIFLKALQELEKKHTDRLTIHWLFSNKMNVYESRMSDWLLTHLMKKHFDQTDKSTLQFYLCGPTNYRLMASISLISNGILRAQIMQEEFNPTPPKHLIAPPDTKAHLVTLHIGDEMATLKVRYPQSILAAAKAHKITLPYSCEMGSCGSCVAQCVSGKIWMAHNEVLTEKDLSKGRILTCQAFPIDSDVTIRI
jgi:ring-1,2-phenylacetyl-CoA epoxidase subunit PaaE